MTEKPPCRLAVLVSGDGSNLQALINGIEEKKLPCTIALVLSNRPDSGALGRAERAGIPRVLLPHKDFQRREDFDRALLKQVNEAAPNLVVLAGFMRILTPIFVDPWQGRLLNLHPSLLPKYPGLRTHEQAIANGDAQHGATVHFVIEDLDQGPRIIQGAVPVRPEHTPESLQEEVRRQEHRILPLAVKWFADGRLEMAENGVLLDGKPLPKSGYRYRGDAL